MVARGRGTDVWLFILVCCRRTIDWLVIVLRGRRTDVWLLIVLRYSRTDVWLTVVVHRLGFNSFYILGTVLKVKRRQTK
jgi:hypothetical protein